MADDQHFPFKRLEAYLERTLPAAEQARWTAHLQNCADCQTQMAAELAFIDELRQAAGAPHSLTPRESAVIRQRLHRRLRRSIIMRNINTAVSYAVSLVLLVAAIALFIWWQQDDPEIGATEALVAATATPEVAATATAVPPTPLASPTDTFPRPPADAMLICQDTVGQSGMSLWHLSASPAGWDRRSARFLNTPGFIAQGVIPLPGGEAILVYGVKVAEDGSAGFQIYLWQAGSERLVVEASQPYTILTLTAGRLSASGYLYAVPADNPQRLVRLDVAQCLSDACEFEPTDRIVVEHPQSGPALEWRLQSDGESLVTIPGLFSDAGVAPFWLDETTLGYLSAVNGLILRQTNAPTEFVSLLDEAQAKALLLASGLIAEADNIILAGGRGTPTHPDIVLASAINFDDIERAFLFVIDRRTGDVRYIPAITAPRLTELAMSPGGNYLVIPAGNELQLYALGTGEIITHPHPVQTMGAQNYAFTADDEWLLLPGATVRMVQPAGEFALERVMEGQRCTLGAWLDTP